ncbi:MAG: Gfo/Idh/MocA family oxidoreductase [Bryobacterales bacterium]|nr:Gfo/Idh/MocA family oxidoreductase [Bryobacterales bacterium]
MRKIKTAVIGTGFMGKVHTEGIRRLGNVEIAGVAAIDEQEARKFSSDTGIENVTTDYQALLADPGIEAVHVCTPNAMHFPMAMAAMAAGKHVLCEKPLAISVEEGRKLVETATEKKLANCTNHNLRSYPMVQQVRRMIEAGDLGEVLVVQGTYSQDWLLYDTDWNWRIDSKEGGRSRCMADIGSHWCDMIEHVTGLRITSVCADIQTFHKTRKKPKFAVETFTGKFLSPEDYDEVPIESEDFGAVLLRLGGRARGAFTASQVAAGNKNRLEIEVYGSKASARWNQEKPDELWIGHRNTFNQTVVKDPSLLTGDAKTFADLPGGHSEGYDDSQKQNFRRFYRKVADPEAPVQYPQFLDGLRQLMILDAVLKSSDTRAWVDVPALSSVTSA